MSADASRTPISINNIDNVRGSLYDDEARPGSSAERSSAGQGGPSRRRAASPHRFTISPLVPESQRESFSELLSKRQPPSCDACRTRKLKCSGRPAVIELGAMGIATRPCANCREWSLDCCYQYQRKRRGRKNRVVERLAQEQQANRQGSDQRSSDEDDEDDSHALDILALGAGVGPSQARRSGSPQPRPVSSYEPIPTWTSPSQPPSGDRSILNGISPTTVAPSFPPNIHDPFASYSQPQPSTSTQGQPYQPQPEPVSQPVQSAAALSQDRGPSLALAEPMPPAFSIESMLPRDLALSVIERYFEHVYCIIPVIHRPTFNADIAMREEERRPILLALIFAMISLTLLHIPRAFFPSLRGDGVRKLSLSCLRAAYSIVRREENVLSVDLICIKYFTFVIHNINGAGGLESAAFGEAIALAITLGLHREDSYHNMNPIEAERRRRVWFLIFNADKFEAVFRARPVLLRPDEFVGPESTEMPAELEDKAITTSGYLPSSAATPLIVGFNILTRLVTIIGDLLIRERDVRRRPPKDPEAVLTALREVRRLQARVKAIADALPMPFKLDIFNALDLPAPGWEDIMRDQLDLFYQDPMASETAKDGYLVMRANIHVTLAMTRLRIILHRDDLLNLAGPAGTPSRNAAELVAADLGESADWRLGVYQDLFNAVHGLPIQALAANGPSLVNKIRVVAVTLIDALPAQDYGNAHVQGIAAYLLDFLNIMTSIESQFND